MVELGAGLGYVSISLAKLGLAKSVTLTDFHPDVLDALKTNVRVNFPDIAFSGQDVFEGGRDGLQVRVEPWNWEEEAPRLDGISLTLAADVVFDPSIVDPLVGAIKKSLEKAEKAIVACTERNPETLDLFRTSLKSNQLESTEEKVEQDAANIFIFNIKNAFQNK